MKIDTDYTLWEGNISTKYRLIITIDAIRDYGTEKEMIVVNESTLKYLFDKYLMNFDLKTSMSSCNKLAVNRLTKNIINRLEEK